VSVPSVILTGIETRTWANTDETDASTIKIEQKIRTAFCIGLLLNFCETGDYTGIAFPTPVLYFHVILTAVPQSNDMDFFVLPDG
jgi:hypothetical protein